MTTSEPMNHEGVPDELLEMAANAVMDQAVDCEEHDDRRDCIKAPGHILYKQLSWRDGGWSEDHIRVEGDATDITRIALAAVLPAHEAMVLARIKALDDDEPEPDEDSCRLVDVDGETVRVRGSGDMDEQDQQALGQVFRAARARMKAEQDAERPEIERQVRAKVAEEITDLLRAAPDHPTAYLRLANYLGDARDAARGDA